MKYAIFLRNALGGLFLATCSMVAQASFIDIDQLSGFINIPNLNFGVSGSDTAIDERNKLNDGLTDFSQGAPDFTVLSATFNNALTFSSGVNKHITGGSFGWTIFNTGDSRLEDIHFYLLLDAILSDGVNSNVQTTGGGSAGDYFEIGKFSEYLSIVRRIELAQTPANNGVPRGDVAGDGPDGTILYALGLDIGSLEINQGFQVTYRFGDTGLFGLNGNESFHLDVEDPRFIPEPSSVAILTLGLIALVTTRRRSGLNTAHPSKPGPSCA